jgi:hypothetical protein
MIGSWRKVDQDGARALRLEGDPPRDPGVYAFVSDDSVMYVGSAQGGLRRRITRYAVTKTMRTSARVRGLILDCLLAETDVDVVTLTPPALNWGGLPVDLIAGVEEGLIRACRPPWNIRSNRD